MFALVSDAVTTGINTMAEPGHFACWSRKANTQANIGCLLNYEKSSAGFTESYIESRASLP